MAIASAVHKLCLIFNIHNTKFCVDLISNNTKVIIDLIKSNESSKRICSILGKCTNLKTPSNLIGTNQRRRPNDIFNFCTIRFELVYLMIGEHSEKVCNYSVLLPLSSYFCLKVKKKNALY